MVTIDDLMEKIDTTNKEMSALKKAFTTGDAPDSMQIEYTPELKTKVFENAPFYRFLQSKNRDVGANSNIVAFYQRTQAQNAKWIKESDTIPAYDKSSYREVLESMKTLIYPMEFSLLSQQGVNKRDVVKDETDAGYIDIYNQLDNALLQGTGTAATNDIKGITKTITTNTADLAGKPITEEAIDDMLVKIIDENGGNPDVIVTNFKIAKQLKKIVADYRRYNDKIDIGLGHRVTAYESISGIEIPILVDGNFATDSKGYSNFAIIDSSTIEIKTLMPPTMFPDLPTDIVGTKQAIISFLACQNIGEFQDGIITGIGEDTTTTTPAG